MEAPPGFEPGMEVLQTSRGFGGSYRNWQRFSRTRRISQSFAILFLCDIYAIYAGIVTVTVTVTVTVCARAR